MNLYFRLESSGVLGLHNWLFCYSSKHTEPSRVSTKSCPALLKNRPLIIFFWSLLQHILLFSIGKLIQCLFLLAKAANPFIRNLELEYIKCWWFQMPEPKLSRFIIISQTRLSYRKINLMFTACVHSSEF